MPSASTEIRQMYDGMIEAWANGPERHRRTALILAVEIRRNYLLAEQDRQELLARIDKEIGKATDW